MSVILKRSLLIWVTIVPLAILNGLLREKILAPLLGQLNAIPLSGITLCLLIFTLTWLCLSWLGQASPQDYLRMGLLWIFLTIGFEFIFGLFVAHKSFQELLLAYDVRTGNLWLLVVLFTGVTPWLSAKAKKLI